MGHRWPSRSRAPLRCFVCAGRGWAHSAAAPQVNPVCHRAANQSYRNNDVIGFKMGGFTGNTVHANHTDNFLPA